MADWPLHCDNIKILKPQVLFSYIGFISESFRALFALKSMCLFRRLAFGPNLFWFSKAHHTLGLIQQTFLDHRPCPGEISGLCAGKIDSAPVCSFF